MQYVHKSHQIYQATNKQTPLVDFFLWRSPTTLPTSTRRRLAATNRVSATAFSSANVEQAVFPAMVQVPNKPLGEVDMHSPQFYAACTVTWLLLLLTSSTAICSQVALNIGLLVIQLTRLNMDKR